MEREFFSWSEWEELDTFDCAFYGCKMNKDFGPLKKGKVYSCINMLFSTGVCQAFVSDDTNEYIEFEFGLVAKE